MFLCPVYSLLLTVCCVPVFLPLVVPRISDQTHETRGEPGCRTFRRVASAGKNPPQHNIASLAKYYLHQKKLLIFIHLSAYIVKWEKIEKYFNNIKYCGGIIYGSPLQPHKKTFFFYHNYDMKSRT